MNPTSILLKIIEILIKTDFNHKTNLLKKKREKNVAPTFVFSLSNHIITSDCDSNIYLRHRTAQHKTSNKSTTTKNNNKKHSIYEYTLIY